LKMPLGSAMAGDADARAVTGTISAMAAMTSVRRLTPAKRLLR
jgi:hypothetical protein